MADQTVSNYLTRTSECFGPRDPQVIPPEGNSSRYILKHQPNKWLLSMLNLYQYYICAQHRRYIRVQGPAKIAQSRRWRTAGWSSSKWIGINTIVRASTAVDQTSCRAELLDGIIMSRWYFFCNWSLWRAISI